MVLVLDCSGSMEGKSITLAKQAAGRAVEMLGPRDQVGVLAFEDKNWWVSPLHVCNDKDDILRRIDTIAAGGETDMYPALDKAYLALRESLRRPEAHHRLDRRRVQPGRFRRPGQADRRRRHHAFDGGRRARRRPGRC